MLGQQLTLAKEFRLQASQGKVGDLKKSLSDSPEILNSKGESSAKTALHFSAQAGHLEIVVYLLMQRGLLIDELDNDLNSALMVALQKGYFTVAKCLLEANCYVLFVNKDQQNSLQLTMQHPETSERNIILDLIKSKMHLQGIHLSDEMGQLHIRKNGEIQRLNPKYHLYSLTYSPLQARLLRLHESFETVVDRNNIPCALLALTEKDDPEVLFHQIEKKLGLTPLQQQAAIKRTQSPIFKKSLVVPLKQIREDKAISFVPWENDAQKEEFISIIKYWLTHSLAANEKINIHKGLTYCVLALPPGEEIVFEQSKLIKIKLIKSGIDNQINFGKSSESTYDLLILQFRDGTQIKCTLLRNQENKKQINNTYRLLLTRGANAHNEFMQLDDRKCYAWDSMTYDSFYNARAITFYSNAHHYIANQLNNLLQTIPAFAWAAKKGITLFSVGCGDGKDLLTIGNQLQSAGHKNINRVGYDINRHNFLPAAEGAVQFLAGDASNLNTLLRATQYSQNSLKIALFIGLLTSGCMKGTYPALAILQQAREMDIIIITGLGVSFLNKNILKAAGFAVSERQIDEKFQNKQTQSEADFKENGLNFTMLKYFQLTPMSLEDRKKYLWMRGINRSSQQNFDCLDLSYSRDPLNDLLSFTLAELQKVKQVDISWGYLNEYEIKPFFAQLSELSHKTLTVLISSQQLQFLLIEQEVNNYPNILLLERLDASGPDEIPIFTPPEARKLGLYDKLPNKTLKKSQSLSPAGLKSFSKAKPANSENQFIAAMQNLQITPSTKNDKSVRFIPYLDNIKKMKFYFIISYWVRHNQFPNYTKLDTSVGLISCALTLPLEEALCIEDKIIVKIKLLRSGKMQGYFMAETFASQTSLLILSLKDGSTLLCTLPEDAAGQHHHFATTTYLALLKRGATVDHTFMNLSARPVFDWKDRHFSAYYVASIIEFYQNMHRFVGMKILNFLKNEPNFGKPRQKAISLFSMGCADGKELAKVEEILYQGNVDVVDRVGFDINPQNFILSNSSAHNLRLIQGDIKDLHALLNKTPYATSSLKIALFIGVLTSGCMDGSYYSLFILQQARIMDLICIGGVTKVLIGTKTLKAAGFLVEEFKLDFKLKPFTVPKEMHPSRKTIQDIGEHKYFQLTAMNAQQRKNYLYERALKRSSLKTFDCLDLSFSRNPLYDLILFSPDSLQKIKQIDISWSYLLEEEVDPFFEQLQQLKVSKLTLLVASVQQQYSKIIMLAEKSLNITLVERLDAANENEIPLFTPPFAKKIGIYTSLPNRTLKK